MGKWREITKVLRSMSARRALGYMWMFRGSELPESVKEKILSLKTCKKFKKSKKRNYG
ncbi:MAG: hypothetical protein LBQ58_03940 [Synergistaceae bacterium]|jgi:hypothetical protein|nr:hypothetical protein [Synergistaceae bacterium]